MKNLRFPAVVASGLACAIFGLAAPAQAVPAVDAPMSLASMTDIPNGIAHHTWIDHTQRNVNVPKVDTSVHQSR